jgi:hypothetical protein
MDAQCVDAPAGPPAIDLASREVDAGRLAPGEERRLSLPWRRVGVGDLRVIAVESDCGCVLAAGPSGAQAAGAHGVIEVRLLAARRPGPFRHRVILYTNQPPPRDAVVCTLRGWSGSRLAFEPARIDLGPRSPDARVERAVEVRFDAPDEGGHDLGARLAGLEGEVVVLPPALHGMPGRLLRVVLRTPAAPGPIDGRVLLERDGRVLATLPIRGRVVP